MREIKFRAWDKQNKTMHNWSEISIEENQIFITDGDLYKTFEQVDTMQYTGFQDTLKKDIYEGDILQLNNNPSFIRLVVFHQPIGGFGLKYQEKPDRLFPIITPMIIERILSCEIVGNIYENRELFTK